MCHYPHKLSRLYFPCLWLLGVCGLLGGCVRMTCPSYHSAFMSREQSMYFFSYFDGDEPRTQGLWASAPRDRAGMLGKPRTSAALFFPRQVWVHPAKVMFDSLALPVADSTHYLMAHLDVDSAAAQDRLAPRELSRQRQAARLRQALAQQYPSLMRMRALGDSAPMLADQHYYMAQYGHALLRKDARVASDSTVAAQTTEIREKGDSLQRQDPEPHELVQEERRQRRKERVEEQPIWHNLVDEDTDW